MNTEITNILSNPFDKDKIRSKTGNFGEEITYVEGSEIIKRLNEAFEYSWSFKIQSHDILNEEVIVIGILKAGKEIKQQFGTSKITRKRETKEAISIGDDLKAAATDSLKKCATLFGLALHLYETPSKNDADYNDSIKVYNTNEDLENPRDLKISFKQLSYITSLAREHKIKLKDYCLEQFNKKIDELSKFEASQLISELLAA
ncbi:MAG: Rad52/Rad22 family DNA repair protein [Pseudomonadota bacterium]